MNLEKRMANLQQRLKHALENGASYDDIRMYEDSISEMVKVSEWLRKQCQVNNRVYFETVNGKRRQYIKFRNETNMDFRLVAMKVNVLSGRKIVDTFELSALNWRAGRTAKMYFDTELEEGCVMSFDPNSIEYYLMNGTFYS